MNTTTRRLLAACLACAAAAFMGSAADAVAQGAPYLELLRSDINAEKVAVMTDGMMLTAEQGDVFWPMYREYQGELAKIGDRRMALIRDFAQNFENLTDEKAQAISKEWFSQHKDRLALLEKTHAKVAKDLGPAVAARFVQIENMLLSLIDVQVAAEMPIFPDTQAESK
jgi:hypothetical protein